MCWRVLTAPSLVSGVVIDTRPLSITAQSNQRANQYIWHVGTLSLVLVLLGLVMMTCTIVFLLLLFFCEEKKKAIYYASKLFT